MEAVGLRLTLRATSQQDEKRWECVDLVKVDLSHNAIASISDEIAALSTATVFKMRQNALTSLPNGFFELTSLTYLDLSRCISTRGIRRPSSTCGLTRFPC